MILGQRMRDAAGEALQVQQSGERLGPLHMLGWIRNLLPVRSQIAPRLQVLERITLAPRHTLALVESEGRRFLIATSPEGAPVFHSLDDQPVQSGLDPSRPNTGGQNASRPVSRTGLHRPAQTSGRVSW
jgi:flagellar biosynthesis protein FliO